MGSIFDGTTIPLLEKVALFADTAAGCADGERRQYRHAELQTPRLAARSVSKALREAIATGQSRFEQGLSSVNGGASTGRRSARSALPEQLFQTIEAQSPSLNFQDNNNRSIEHEMMELTKNSLMQSFAIELMNAQFGMLQAAIREQV